MRSAANDIYCIQFIVLLCKCKPLFLSVIIENSNNQSGVHVDKVGEVTCQDESVLTRNYFS